MGDSSTDLRRSPTGCTRARVCGPGLDPRRVALQATPRVAQPRSSQRARRHHVADNRRTDRWGPGRRPVCNRLDESSDDAADAHAGGDPSRCSAHSGLVGLGGRYERRCRQRPWGRDPCSPADADPSGCGQADSQPERFSRYVVPDPQPHCRTPTPGRRSLTLRARQDPASALSHCVRHRATASLPGTRRVTG